ncbi:MAG: hypothetical protein P4M11_13935 [Candidatus Pacebacteria bacterium]|nr:hypothetical protein [Candidatus Paceibacterota bacterium]
MGIIADLQAGIRRVHEETAVIEKEQGKYIKHIGRCADVKSTVARPKPDDDPRYIKKDRESYGKKMGVITDETAQLQQESAEWKRQVAVEKSMKKEISGIIAKMKGRIAAETKTCEKLRRELGLAQKRCGQLKQRADSIVF